jgi:hypothetical protein
MQVVYVVIVHQVFERKSHALVPPLDLIQNRQIYQGQIHKSIERLHLPEQIDVIVR